MPADPRVNVGTAALFLRDEQGLLEVLLIHRRPDASHGGDTWCAPGGWIDYGQSPEEAAAREALEEANVVCKAEDGRLVSVTQNTYPEQDKHIVCLTILFEEYDAVNVRNVEPDKHASVKWVPVTDLPSLSLFPPFADLATQMGWI